MGERLKDHKIFHPWKVLANSLSEEIGGDARGVSESMDGRGGGGSESMDGRGCAILALEVVPKNLIFT